MHLTNACTRILNQLGDLINDLGEQDFIRPIDALGGATIGQHIRHTLEFFICLETGFAEGTINYDKRSHDKRIETDKRFALDVMNSMKLFIKNQREDKLLKLDVGYDLEQEHSVTIETNYKRELVYNIEHAVHHMALIKIGVREVAAYVQLPFDFGVAASTIRYKQTASTN